MFEKKSLHSRNSHVGHSIVIHESTQIRYVGLYRFEFDLFMQSILHEKTDVWTGPKLQFTITMQ